MNIIQNKKWFLSFSLILIILACTAIFLFGFKAGIDLEGGTLWRLNINEVSNKSEIIEFFESDLKREVTIREISPNTYLLRLGTLSKDEHNEYRVKLLEKYPSFTELSYETIGPTIGKELRKNAIVAIVLVLIGISLYVAFIFRGVSEPVQSWKYGIVTLITLFHDILIPAGLYSYLGYRLGIQIDTNFIVALLVIMGFSVHDTIVVFDRIRESLIRSKKDDFGILVNRSVTETFARSANTSLTLVVVLIALLIVGPQSLFYFILTILIGILAGTYSSIFVASPLLVLWHNLSLKKANT